MSIMFPLEFVEAVTQGLPDLLRRRRASLSHVGYVLELKWHSACVSGSRRNAICMLAQLLVGHVHKHGAEPPNLGESKLGNETYLG